MHINMSHILDTIDWIRRIDLEVDEIECILIEVRFVKAKSFLVGCMYRPLDASLYTQPNFKNLLNEMLLKVNDQLCETTLLGDLNIKFLKSNKNRDLKEAIKADFHSNYFHACACFCDI